MKGLSLHNYNTKSTYPLHFKLFCVRQRLAEGKKPGLLQRNSANETVLSVLQHLLIPNDWKG